MKIGVSNNRSSYFRNFVFGVEDSLVSTVGLLSGISIVGMNEKSIIATGVVLIFVEAVSMGAGSFLSESSVEIYESRQDNLTNRPFLGAVVMFTSYLISGFIPLFPYLVFSKGVAFWTSISLSLAVLFVLGITNAKISGTNIWKSAFRMAIIGGGAIAVGSVVGKLLG